MKHDLKDITFVIPFYLENKERSDNLYCIYNFLRDNFETNFFLIQSYREIGEQLPISDFFIRQENEIFHRTKVINAGIKSVQTKYFSIYDTDTIFSIENIVAAALRLRDGAQAVYPYDGRFIDIDRSYLRDGIIKEATSFATESKGGAVFLNTKDYFSTGLENENIISWGPEDAERYERMKTLGFRIERMPGKCWHISHQRGVNSGPQNPHTTANNSEYEKVKAMNKEELQAYIKTWAWAGTPTLKGEKA